MSEQKKHYDVIITGAGAAGLMCAISAGKQGKNVLLIEHNKNVGDKIRISGGGRCNFTNLNIDKSNYLSRNPYFCLSALNNFSNHDFISMVEKHQIHYHEKTLGQLFCDNSSKEIINMLLNECSETKVTITTETKVTSLKKEKETFTICTNQGDFSCSSTVIATGALSIPKMGATDFGYKIAKQFDLNIITPEAALVPLSFNDNLIKKTKHLSGVSVEYVTATCNKQSFCEDLLFTHKGLSGPVILQISSYWNPGDEITINLATGLNMLNILKEARTEQAKQEIATILSDFLPKKFAIFLSEKHNCKTHIADMTNQKLEAIANDINNWRITPSSTEGFVKAEVTKGGIDTDEINAKTFEAKKVSGLYFIGEVLDVTGHLGGYNFQWAWSSGYVAGQYA